MNILLTGVAGFIGSHLCHALLNAGHTVVGVDNMNSFYDPEFKKLNLEAIEESLTSNQAFYFYVADVRDTRQIKEICLSENIDTIIHLAALAGVEPSLLNPAEYYLNNVLGTQHLLDVTQDLKIKHFILASSSSVYGADAKLPFQEFESCLAPLSPYALSKRMSELVLEQATKLFELKAITLRFFTVYGPRLRPDLAIAKFCRQILRGQKIPLQGDGSQTRDVTYIDDVVAGILLALKNIPQQTTSYECYNLGQNQSHTLLEIVEILAKVTEQSPQFLHLPARKGDMAYTCADITKAKQNLGYDPQTSLEQGLSATFDWCQKFLARI